MDRCRWRHDVEHGVLFHRMSHSGGGRLPPIHPSPDRRHSRSSCRSPPARRFLVQRGDEIRRELGVFEEEVVIELPCSFLPELCLDHQKRRECAFLRPSAPIHPHRRRKHELSLDTDDHRQVFRRIPCHPCQCPWPSRPPFLHDRIPSAVVVEAARKRNLDPSHESWFVDATAFPYRAYADRFVYWESLVLFRKAPLTIVVAVGYHLGSNLQAILAVCILTTALYLHTICHPFRNEFASLNVYEEAVLFFSDITFVMALLFNDDRIGNALRVVLSVLFFLSICGLLAFLGFVFSQATFAYMRVVLEIEEVPQIDTLGNLRVMREFMILKVAQNVPRTRSFIRKSKADEEQTNIGLNTRRDSAGFSSGL